MYRFHLFGLAACVAINYQSVLSIRNELLWFLVWLLSFAHCLCESSVLLIVWMFSLESSSLALTALELHPVFLLIPLSFSQP